MRTSKVQEFNNNFLKYDGKADITVDDIATLMNFAKHNNDSYELFLGGLTRYTENQESPYFVDVIVKNVYMNENNLSSTENYFCMKCNDYSEFKSKLRKFLFLNNTTLFKCNCQTITVDADKKIKITHKDTDLEIDNDEGETGRVTKIIFEPSNITDFNNGESVLITTKNKDEYEF